MGWRAALRLSNVAFAELALQAIYAFRQGNTLPQGATREIPARARRRVRQSQAVVAAVLGLVAVGAALALRSATVVSAHLLPQPIPVGTFDAGVLTVLLSLDMAFLWWTGLQVLPTFLSSSVLPVLEPLPIDEPTLRRAAVLLYFRLFDLPVLTVLGLTPVLVGLALGPLAGLALFPGLLAASVFALTLSLVTGRFFVRRVQGSRGGGGRTLLRWTYLVLWVVPAFGMFGFVTLAPTFFASLGAAASAGPSVGFDVWLVAFPFPLGTLSALAGGGVGSLPLDGVGLALLATACAGYLALGAWAARWMGSAVREVGRAPVGVPRPASVAPVRLGRAGPVASVLFKDLRISSRSPGYAFLILLPILDAAAIGLLTYFAGSNPGTVRSLGLGAVTTAALLATFFGPAFFAIEVIAYSYGRTLPLSDRSLVLGKVLLIAAIYLIAGGVVLGLANARLNDPLGFLAFIAAELPAVLAAAFLELGIVLARARKTGLPIVNLFAGAWVALLVSLPGLGVAIVPLIVFGLVPAGGPIPALGVMGLVALAELAVAAPYALRGDRS